MSTSKPSRSIARLVAVQALFNIEATRKSVAEIVAQFESKSLDELMDAEVEATDFDRKHFSALIRATVDNQAKIDQTVNRILKEGWPLKSIDPILRAIFRAASAEFILAKAPMKVTINEFLEVTKAFDERKETVSFVNAVLDQVAKSL